MDDLLLLTSFREGHLNITYGPKFYQFKRVKGIRGVPRAELKFRFDRYMMTSCVF